MIDNSDIVSGALLAKGYANNNYQFTIYCYDAGFRTVSVPFNALQLSVTSDYIRLNGTTYSNVVPMSCYGVQAAGQSAQNDYMYSCSFLPNVNGTYYINSPYLPSGRSFHV